MSSKTSISKHPKSMFVFFGVLFAGVSWQILKVIDSVTDHGDWTLEYTNAGDSGGFYLIAFPFFLIFGAAVGQSIYYKRVGKFLILTSIPVILFTLWMLLSVSGTYIY